MRNIRRRIVGFLDRSPVASLLLCAGLLATAALLHRDIGYQYGVAYFYIVPIIVAARFLGRKSSVAAALASAVAWSAVDRLMDTPYHATALLAAWNFALRLATFLTVALTVSGLERERSQERRLSMAKSDMIALVSHQFSNALTTMGLVMMLLEDSDAEDSESQRRGLYRILGKNIRDVQALVMNFLNEARLSSGHFALEPKPTDIGCAVRSAVDALAPLSEQKKLSVRLDLPPGELTVDTDPDALNLVLNNLIGNAVKYTPSKGTITVGARGEGLPANHFLVWVEDTGIGMTEAEKARALEGFQRADGAKKMAKGFGLGLKVTNEMLLSLGSRLLIESSPGRGSRFSFVLPAHDEAPAPKPAEAAV